MNFNMSVSSSSSSSHNGVVTSQSSMSSSVAGGSGGMSGSMAMASSGGGGLGMGMMPGMGMPTMPMMPGAGAAASMNASMHGMQAGMGAAMGGALAIAGIMGELASALVTVVPFVKPHDGSYIGVQTDKAAYSAGETLQGFVVLQNNSPRQIDSVVVVVSVVERTRWDEEVAVQRSSGEGENRKTWTEYNHHHHTGEITHLKERVEVSRLAVMLGPGSYSYPFKYALRSDLPGCVRYNKSEKADDPAWRRPLETFCEVVYTVEAYVDTHGMFDKDLSSKQELVVNSAFNWAAMKPQVGAQHGQVLFCCCVPRGQVSLTAAFDRAAYMAGETAQIKAGITNDSEQDVKKMGVRLLRRIVLRANDGNKKVIEDVMCKQNYPGVEKHSAAVRDLPLPLLSGAGNLQPGTRGQLVEIGYTFRVACDMFCEWQSARQEGAGGPPPSHSQTHTHTHTCSPAQAPLTLRSTCP